jgi:hypothetical protein
MKVFLEKFILVHLVWEFIHFIEPKLHAILSNVLRCSVFSAKRTDI